MFETQSTRRLQWLLWLLLVWVGAIFGRLLWLQVFQHDDLLRQAQMQQQRMVEVPAMRGAILDRFHQPLAKSLPAESICVNPQRIPDANVAADLLSRLLELDRAKLLERISAARLRNSGFMWVKRKVSAEEADRVRSLKLDWVEFREEMRRFYPQGELAAHVIGSTGVVDDGTERGNAGVELEFDEELSGRPGLARVYTDVKQNAYDSLITRKPEPGSDLILTIDPNIQHEAEKQLDKAVESSGAKTGSIVAVNPSTGDILAMANYPRFDPNLPPRPGDPADARSNLAIATPFEPGSVFKVITLSAALETTSLTPDSIINCGNGVINLFGRVIHDEHRYSALKMSEVLAHSSNIGAIQIGLKVGERPLYQYQRKFGFGQKSGIDLPGESAGLLRRVEQWTPSSIGSLAMGHEVGVTSVQLAMAGAAIANGGMKIRPRILLAKKKPGEPEERFATDKPERILQPETAIKMRQMMEGVVLMGTGKRAAVKGYTTGGKTGSAQIYDLKTHVYTHHYNASFLGFAPVANPQIVIVVTLEGTTGGTAGFGGAVAAPVFREVATSALRILDVPKDLPETPGRPQRHEKPESDLAIAGLSGAPPLLDPSDGSRAVSSVTPPPVQAEAPASSGASTPRAEELSSQGSLDRRPFLASSFGGTKVPDFRGMTLRAVLEESSAAGLAVEVLGSGLARNQDPPAGTPLPPQARVRIEFGR